MRASVYQAPNFHYQGTLSWQTCSTSGRERSQNLFQTAAGSCNIHRHHRANPRCLALSLPSKSTSNCVGHASSPADSGNGAKLFDVVAISNLCVDVFVPVEQLPPAEHEHRKQLLQDLTAHPPPTDSWEVGGNTNFLIAASRLGLKTASIGHIGDDIYGEFLSAVLKDEGIDCIEPIIQGPLPSHLNTTLLCFVLVNPESQHAFCSTYDFGPWPLLPVKDEMPDGVQRLLENTAAVFVNGFAFDDLPAEVVLMAARQARAVGAAVFFDPGPRAWTFSEGQRAQALSDMLDLSDVVLMTEEEAAAVTGRSDSEAAAHWILDRPHTATRWCIVKRGARGALLASTHEDCNTHKLIHEQEALKIDVRDTVGCGDSFAAAVVLGYIHRHSIHIVMALANAVGAATAMGAGAGRNVARAETVLMLLEGELERTVDEEDEDDSHNGAIQVLQHALEKAGRV